MLKVLDRNRWSISDLATNVDVILGAFYDGIYLIDRDGTTLMVNRAYELASGIKGEEVIGQKVMDLENRGFFSPIAFPEVINTGKSVTVPQTTRAGRKVVVTGNPVFDSDGAILYVVTNVRDIIALDRSKEKNGAEKFENVIHPQHLFHWSQQSESGLCYRSEAMEKVVDLVHRVAGVDATVMILGETGVGKEVVAKLIHKHSVRSEGPFFKINCAAIPESLIESEFFGYMSGAFTGSHPKGKAGIFEMADGGTLLLDEIGDLPLNTQAKLLRVLQDQEVTRLGSSYVKKVNVRILAATNRSLEEMVSNGQFRQDLFYRLRVVIVEIPPLRKRREDISVLLDYFFTQYNSKYHRSLALAPAAKTLLEMYKWPGNVRELENLVQELIVTHPGRLVDVLDLPVHITSQVHRQRGIEWEGLLATSSSLPEMIRQTERRLLEKAVHLYGGDVRVLAQELGVDRTTVIRKLKRYGLYGKT